MNIKNHKGQWVNGAFAYYSPGDPTKIYVRYATDYYKFEVVNDDLFFDDDINTHIKQTLNIKDVLINK